MGWKIFSHSVFLLNHNLRDALRISSPLIATMLLNLFLGGAMAIDNLEAGTPQDTGPNLLLTLLSAIAGLWVAVAWHRFVLLEEHGGSLPNFHGARMLSYFFVILLMTVVLALAGAVAGAVGAMLFGSSTPLFSIVVLAIVVSAMWIFYRLSPLLPAAALGKYMRVKRAWEATSEISGAVLAAALLLIFFSILSGAAALLVMFQVSILIGVIMIAVLQWAYTMVGISILTTIYGIAIEGRDI
ncbi:hypothetical protein RSK20926_08462 [Roseobacter sp. SK209-2-6]|uniref:hypothetical protein n=1 Tax=Roseobacter sp. SK209-2-6 TaxID=388739 RepID=UPI0000F3D112|nr:hypothetical protein [Roseobacter sp. SK209-2-6]EBA16988.1 hypothetical protein RSK20926_08462 [Roseobacter sp. SK209-2-6]